MSLEKISMLDIHVSLNIAINSMCTICHFWSVSIFGFVWEAMSV